jgi:hypothetical protein
MRFIDSQMPRRKRKPKPTPLDEFEPFLVLKSVILNGKMRPSQEVGLLFDPSA